MKIPSIHVGCGEFSLQRLELLINGNQFAPIACVDIDIEKAIVDKMEINSIKYPVNLSKGNATKYNRRKEN